MDSSNDEELLNFSFVRRPSSYGYFDQPSTSPSSSSSSPYSTPTSPSSSTSLSAASSSTSTSSSFSLSSLKMFLTNNYHNIANCGNELAQAGSYERAIEYLSLAISLNSSDYRLYYNRALCYLETNELDKAFKDISRTIRSNPLWSKGYFALGQSLARARQYKQAEKAYKKALSLENENETRTELIGNIYDALIDCGYDEIKAGFASEKYFSIEEALEALAAGAFETNLNLTRSIKKKYYKRQQYKKGILIPVNFF